jgi:hypothetical protein
MTAIKTVNGITDPDYFKWFKATNKTVSDVTTGLTASGIAAGGQEWYDGALTTGQLNGIDYVDFSSINSFSTFGGIWEVNVNKVLPVTWVDVQAVPENNSSIRVKWSTASEINNAGFTVERSEDGRRFLAIASANAQTGNAGTAYYSVVDNNVQPGITYYYRIKQTDINSRVEYSKTVTARINSGDKGYMQIHPNPVSGSLQWNLYTSRSQNLQVSITDIAGRIVARKIVLAQAGSNKYTMDVSALGSGTYLLQVADDTGSLHVEKFIVQ